MSAEDVEALGMRCRWGHYSAHQEIVGYLDDSQDVFFVISGEVRAVIYSMSGKEVTFRDLGPGQMFGEFAAIDGQPRSATVVAQSDSVVASMSPAVFRELLHDHAEVTVVVLQRLVSLARSLSERIVEFSTLAVKNRIHAELLRLARSHMADENTAVIKPAPTHVDIASRVSTHREAVTRELSALQRANMIERRGGGLVIKDVSALTRLVEEVIGETPPGFNRED